MNNATVLHPGFYSSIQDLGRLQYRNIGVPQSGAMDMETARQLNEVLGNDEDAAVLEMISVGATLKFDQETIVVLSQNIDHVLLNNSSVNFSKPIHLKSGSELKIGRAVQSNFMYLAIAGGWQTESVLGSRSMYQGITPLFKWSKGDVIRYARLVRDVDVNRFRESELHQTTKINVYPGLEFNLLNDSFKDQLMEEQFAVSKKWNRMAFQIETGVSSKLPQIKTAPVMPGTVQLTPSGMLMILMRDAQTTGGYPRILQLSETSINAVARKNVGDPMMLALDL